MAEEVDVKGGAGKRQLVRQTAGRLRDLIFAQAPDELIGSLPDLARLLGVGIVTVQQAARILEHEGMLEVRRGPGGGYYGKRPDAASLERSLAAYMRMQPHSWEEALDMTSLLFNELCAAAAREGDAALHSELRDIAGRIDSCAREIDTGEWEEAFQDLLFRMVERPLFELLTRVTLRFATSRPTTESIYRDAVAIDGWKAGRHRIIDAILSRDEELARFEAERSNRRVVLDWLGRQRGG
ncbi:MAG: FCD domain-containing protein [Novosphingobium sp.]|jgi:DNA-binding FadR family transcriptional regulator|nr:FCD domain-containing protein [Novosphingobium sp.]